MKKRVPTFVAGMLTTALIGSLGVGALAATGALTISVNPINVQVNGQTFQPKDAQGNSVPVFTYNGTTYAPLRALAEAYGLEVGYDEKSNMATVGAKAATPATTSTPDTTVSADYSDWTAEEEKAYQEFKGMWAVEFRDKGDRKYHIDGSYDKTPWESYTLNCIGSLTYTEVANTLDVARGNGFVKRLASEICTRNVIVEMYFISESGATFGVSVDQ